MPQFDPIKCAETFYKHYHFDSEFSFNRSKQMLLGNKENRICRYCGRTDSDVSFNKTAHTIPQLLDNKFVICNYECDQCNEIFGEYENSLANYIGLRRFFISKNEYGKTKQRSYKYGSKISILIDVS